MAPLDSGQFSPNTTTCGACHRMVHVVAGVTVDPEILSVVTCERGRPGTARSARRVHAELCERYQEEARRRQNTAALKRYNRRNGRRESGL